ncbi:MAG: hypothetical protein H7343_08655 [Undibacterium sp.]|nr:hypothetical protein [Opitutaceae bacterium]
MRSVRDATGDAAGTTCGVEWGGRPKGASWISTEAEIAALENDLGSLWARPDGRMKGKTKRKLTDYVVRYHGVETGDRRMIMGEGQHASAGNAGAFFGEVRDTFVLRTFGGGERGFELRYDAAAKRVTEVRFGAAL